MELFPGSRLILQVEPAPWAHLVRLSASLLERDGVVTTDYVKAIFDSFKRNGDYMVIAPKVLLAHARPEEGAVATGLSLVTTSADVAFNDDADVPLRLFFTLAAADSTAHLDLLAQLAEVLMDEQSFDELLSSKDTGRVLQLLNPA